MWNFVATDVYALFNSHVEKSTTGSCKTEGGGGQGPFTQCVKNIWFGRGWLPLSIADFFHLVMAQLEERKGFPDDILFVFTSHLRSPAVHRTCSLLEAIVKTCSLLEAVVIPVTTYSHDDPTQQQTDVRLHCPVFWKSMKLLIILYLSIGSILLLISNSCPQPSNHFSSSWSKKNGSFVHTYVFLPKSFMGAREIIQGPS